MLESDEPPQILTEQSDDYNEALGDHVPFTLGSPQMTPYIATMTPEWQEAFEVETAQIQARIRLQEAQRVNEGVADNLLVGRARSATEIKEIPCRNLDGRVQRLKSAETHPKYSSDPSGMFVGHLTTHGKARMKVAIYVKKMIGGKKGWWSTKTAIIYEATLWASLDHPNILKLLGLAPDQGWQPELPALVTPYCENGMVNDYLDLHSDTNQRLSIITGVSEGLRYLHRQNVRYLDFTPTDILINDDGRPLLYKFISVGRRLTKNHYSAPEMVVGLRGSKEANVYSFALISYTIWTGLQPLPEGVATMEETGPTFPDPAPPGSDSIWRVLKNCWKTEPEERWEMEAVAEELGEISIATS